MLMETKNLSLTDLEPFLESSQNLDQEDDDIESGLWKDFDASKTTNRNQLNKQDIKAADDKSNRFKS